MPVDNHPSSCAAKFVKHLHKTKLRSKTIFRESNEVIVL